MLLPVIWAAAFLFSVLNKKKTRTAPLAESSQKIILFDYIVSIPRAARMRKWHLQFFFWVGFGIPRIVNLVMNETQKLSMWKRNSIQDYVEHKAHRCGIRISHICAWGQANLPLMAAVLSSVMKPTIPLQPLQAANNTTVTLVRATTLALATLSESC